MVHQTFTPNILGEDSLVSEYNGLINLECKILVLHLQTANCFIQMHLVPELEVASNISDLFMCLWFLGLDKNI